MDKRAAVVLGIVFGGLFLIFFGFLLVAVLAVQGGGGAVAAAGPKIGVVEIQDMIVDSKEVLEQLETFREDDSIEAVLVRIDSPGGAVAPSQEIHDALLATREHKKVVVSMANLAASGGYYIAVAADEIVANPGTLTGSIGVITQFTNFKDLAEWAKVDVETIKSGALKDAGNPFREMTETERAYWQDLVMNIYEQFVTAVAEGRGMELDEVRPYADGRVFTGQMAKELGFVDRLGNFDFAVARTAELAGIEGKPSLVYPEKDEREMLREILSGGAESVVGALRNEVTRAVTGGSGPGVWLLPAAP